MWLWIYFSHLFPMYMIPSYIIRTDALESNSSFIFISTRGRGFPSRVFTLLNRLLVPLARDSPKSHVRAQRIGAHIVETLRPLQEAELLAGLVRGSLVPARRAHCVPSLVKIVVDLQSTLPHVFRRVCSVGRFNAQRFCFNERYIKSVKCIYWVKRIYYLKPYSMSTRLLFFLELCKIDLQYVLKVYWYLFFCIEIFNLHHCVRHLETFVHLVYN